MRGEDLHLCAFCHRSVEKPCASKQFSDSCTQSISRTRGGGSGAKTIAFNVSHRIDFHWFLDRVKAQWQIGKLRMPQRDPLRGFKPEQIEKLLEAEAYMRYTAWQKAARKGKPKYEVLMTPFKGSNHEVRVRRRFRDFAKAEAYCRKRNEDPERTAGFDIQLRQSIQPVQPKHLLGFDPQSVLQPNQVKESIMAKAKAKGKKAATNGAGKTPKVAKNKAYYLKCVSGALPKTSGDFIRGRILQGKMTAEEIATEVKKKFKGHSTKPSDVYWNRGQLKAQGIAIPKTMGAAAK